MKYLIIPTAYLIAYYFVNIAGIHLAIKKGFKIPAHKRLKPFDCVTCLSVWVAVALYFMPLLIIQFLFTIFASGYLGQKIK